ncbi:ABC-type Fe3+-hydroxamate transport system, substrate-binding protein [Candidatus Kryptonium thompsonii]|uniref:ABC-type Fe3+-hydroxamate transport system, substrate-binding protein n=2 Tax=Candidatus Kryptonium thompsonii TaxID=1633631 RepID=A0A0P1MLC9_9BACT|nr:ABC transporter substrate-binding protein [Candidatus Kryptonium thompsoni]CUS76388.1 ABC-type Fe3+-hydroxamate transport system, substrate-binding protein [Candidatus Kryptonium thompsoni]CUS78604.1 ABC-type Fe3+-hydroxamate transport system, substrate-binding protein [Candidatus Kryptonium thompsoni]CUS78940.1 ABC-type Fe3+-hydroxamate transport system, substrate-binding protein [Candidatus Kryptonium thompsoni]CUS82124.1 ABC-type Fe3+-hydroxamate transport system, substrate-binding protei
MRKVYCEITGKELFLPDRCERIVSFSPAVTEALFEMGLGEFVLGVSVYCVRPQIARKKVIVGSYNTFNEEKLRKLNPDIIFTTTGYQLDLIKNLGEKFQVYPVRLPPSVSEIISTSYEAGVVAGYFSNARELERKLTNKLSETISDRKANKPKVKVYVEIDLGGPVTFGAYSYITDAIELLGGENIFGNYPAEWITPDDNKVKELNPDVIIYEPKMFSKNRDKDKIVNFLRGRFGDVKAIKEDKVFITPGIYDFLAHHGPSFITEVMPWLKEIIDRE